MNTVAKPFDPKAVKLLTSYDVAGTLFAVCLDAARSTLYGAGSDGSLHTVDLTAEKPTVTKRMTLHDNYVSGLTLAEGQLISCSFDRTLAWTDPESGQRIRSTAAHDGWVRKLTTTPDGTKFVTVGDDMRVKVWESGSGKCLASLEGHAHKTPEGYLSALYTVAVSPDGRHAASGDRAGFVRVWDLRSGALATEFRAIELYTFDDQKRARAIGGVRGLAFSPDGSRLAVSGIGPVTNVDGFVGPCRVELWDWKAGQRIAVGQDKHQAILNQVTFGPTDSWLLGVGGGDGGGALVCWDSSASAGPHVLKPKGHLHAFVLDSVEHRLYAAGHGGFQVWQLRSE